MWTYLCTYISIWKYDMKIQKRCSTCIHIAFGDEDTNILRSSEFFTRTRKPAETVALFSSWPTMCMR